MHFRPPQTASPLPSRSRTTTNRSSHPRCRPMPAPPQRQTRFPGQQPVPRHAQRTWLTPFATPLQSAEWRTSPAGMHARSLALDLQVNVHESGSTGCEGHEYHLATRRTVAEKVRTYCPNGDVNLNCWIRTSRGQAATGGGSSRKTRPAARRTVGRALHRGEGRSTDRWGRGSARPSAHNQAREQLIINVAVNISRFASLGLLAAAITILGSLHG